MPVADWSRSFLWLLFDLPAMSFGHAWSRPWKKWKIGFAAPLRRSRRRASITLLPGAGTRGA
jgi:hypothetical protein